MSGTPCPDRRQLRAYCAGRLSGQTSETLADHIDACPACQARLSTLNEPEDTLVQRIRSSPAKEPFEDEPQCRAAAQRAKALVDSTNLLSEMLQRAQEIMAGDGDNGPFGQIQIDGQKAVDRGLEVTTDHLPPRDDELPDTLPHPSGRRATADRRFRVVRLHARGGLGQVSVAVDEDLHRQVAFKELLVHCADDPECRTRFVAEAEITGSLEHPGIVPVHALGRFSDGRPYYVMRFIQGQTLKEAIRGFHKKEGEGRDRGESVLELRRLLGHFLDVCHAVDYAHHRKVLHRDLKPSNIVLGEFGETLVIDWGLAKIVGRTEPAAPGQAAPAGPLARGLEDLTRAGRVMGTPSYMSPEQAAGQVDGLGPATDVYSLGAVLYALLTNRPPIEADNVGRALERICRGDFPRPRAVRRHVPPALEAICLKAMALKPEDRYLTAAGLAEDIEHWLADEPVAAHRETLRERIGRWMRRHRTWTQAGAAALAAVAVIAVAATVLVNRARQEAIALAIDNENLAVGERQARMGALTRLREARAAVDLWLTGAADAMRHYPGVQEARKRLLEQAAQDYERFAKQSSDDDELETERGRIYLRLGDIRRLLGEFAEAQQAYQAAESLFRDLAADRPDGLDSRLELANSHLRLGQMLADTGRAAEAQQAYQAATTALEALVERDPEDERFRDALATSLVSHGDLLAETTVGKEAEAKFRKAAELFAKLVREKPDQTRYHVSLATAQDLLGRACANEGRNDEALAQLTQALETMDRLVDRDPANPKHLETRAATRVFFANVLRNAGRPQQELESYQTAIADYRALVKMLPDAPLYRESLALTWTDLAQLLHDQGSNAEAEVEASRAVPVFTQLASDFPQVPRHGEEQAAARDILGESLGDLGRPKEARLALEPAVETLGRLAKDFPDVPEYRQRLAVARSHLAKALHKLGEVKAAEDMFLSASKALEDLCRVDAKTVSYRDAMAFVYVSFGVLLQESGRPDEAESVLQKARQAWKELADRHHLPEHQYNLAWFLANCPMASLRDPQAAMELATQAKERAPTNPNYWRALGAAYYRAGQWQLGLKAIQEAIRLRSHSDARDGFLLAMLEHQSGQPAEARKSYDQARKAMEANTPGNLEVVRVRKEAAQLLKLAE